MLVWIIANDFLSMSLTTDRASPSPAPSVWRMRNAASAPITLGACKLALRLGPAELQALAFVTLVFGNQALPYVLPERHHLWHSRPSIRIPASSAVDIGFVVTLASVGILMGALPRRIIALLFAAALGVTLFLDQIKRLVLAAFGAN